MNRHYGSLVFRNTEAKIPPILAIFWNKPDAEILKRIMCVLFCVGNV